jgi:hypothetical protein
MAKTLLIVDGDDYQKLPAAAQKKLLSELLLPPWFHCEDPSTAAI